MRNGYCTRVSACGKFSKNKSRGKDHRCAEFEFVRIDFRFCGIFIFAIDFSQPTLTRDDGTKIWTPWFVRNWKMFVFIAGLLNDGTRPSYIVATRRRRVYQLVIRISKIFCIPDQFFLIYSQPSCQSCLNFMELLMFWLRWRWFKTSFEFKKK